MARDIPHTNMLSLDPECIHGAWRVTYHTQTHHANALHSPHRNTAYRCLATGPCFFRRRGEGRRPSRVGQRRGRNLGVPVVIRGSRRRVPQQLNPKPRPETLAPKPWPQARASALVFLVSNLVDCERVPTP